MGMYKLFGFIRVFSIFIIIILLLVSASCSDDATGIYSQQFSSEIQEKLENKLEEKMAEYNCPGAVVGIWVPGEGTWVKTKGKSNIEEELDMAYFNTFRIGSISKTFNVTIILQLVDEGLLSLDDTLDKFIPRVPHSDIITIRHLCGNTTGIFNYGLDPDLNEVYIESDFLAGWTPDELIDIAIGHEPLFMPGEGFDYSNTNFVILAKIIEYITGNTYEEELKTRIFEPLNLKYTTYPVVYSNKMTGPYSHGYHSIDGVLKDYTECNHSVQFGMGGVISNLPDLKTYAECLGEGFLLSEEMQEKRLKWSSFSENGPFKYGLGIFYMGDFIGHDGGAIGYNSALFYNPQNKSTFIILFNQSPNFDAALLTFAEMAEIIFPGSIFPHEEKREILTNENFLL